MFRKNKDQEHGCYVTERRQFQLVELEDEAFLRVVHEPGQYRDWRRKTIKEDY